MGGPYLNSLIPIVGGVAASAWAPMSSAITPTATNAHLYHASALVSSFMVLSLPFSLVRTLHHRRRSIWFRRGLEGTNSSLWALRRVNGLQRYEALAYVGGPHNLARHLT